MRGFALGRIGLGQLLRDAEISKNTFFRKFRYDPEVARLLDIQEDRDHRLHFRADGGALLKRVHAKAPHGNRGRQPARACPACATPLHPRHRACLACGHVLVAEGSTRDTPKRSSAEANYRRRARLKELKSSGRDEPGSP